MKRLLTAIAGVSLLAAAPVAQAADAARSSAPIEDVSAMGGKKDTLIYILGAIALGLALFLILDNNNNDNDNADSP